MTRLLAWGIDRPRQVLLVTALVTLGFLAQFPRAVIDTDPENMLEPDQADRAFYAQVKEDFGIYDLIVAGVRDPDGIFRVDTLQRLARIADGIVRVLATRLEQRTMLLLEHTAGQGTNLGHTFQQLGTIITEVERAETATRIGVCLDTCHLLAAGYDLGSDAGYADTMRQLDTCVGLDRLRALHLNDSKTPLGSRVDRHTHIGSGHVGLSAFQRLLTDPRLDDLPMVLETPKAHSSTTGDIEPDPMDLENLRTLRTLMAGDAP